MYHISIGREKNDTRIQKATKRKRKRNGEKKKKEKVGTDRRRKPWASCHRVGGAQHIAGRHKQGVHRDKNIKRSLIKRHIKQIITMHITVVHAIQFTIKIPSSFCPSAVTITHSRTRSLSMIINAHSTWFSSALPSVAELFQFIGQLLLVERHQFLAARLLPRPALLVRFLGAHLGHSGVLRAVGGGAAVAHLVERALFAHHLLDGLHLLAAHALVVGALSVPVLGRDHAVLDDALQFLEVALGLGVGDRLLQLPELRVGDVVIRIVSS